jgi:cytochrome c oxidase subunit 2
MDQPKTVHGNGRGGASLIWIIVAGLAIIVGGLLIATLTPYVLPTVGSAEARQVDDLFRFMLALGGMIFLLVQGAIAYSVIRFRTKTNDIADGPPIQGNTTLEFVWTVIPAIVVVVLTIYAYSVFTSIQSEKPNEQTVEAIGQRFAWSFTYAVPADQLPESVDQSRIPEDVRSVLDTEGQVTFGSPQLHTWVGQPVNVLLQSEDVNHAFWIPGMRVKQDLLPGRVTNIRFTPVEAGVYRIVCAELCGSGHGDMAGRVTDDGELAGAWLIVHQDEDTFLREFWSPEVAGVLNPPEDPAVRGRTIIQNYPCSGCHALSDLGWTGVTGPSLDGISQRTQRVTATGAASMEDYIHSSVRNPTDYVVPGYNPLMPQFNDAPDESNYMPEDHLEAIVAYLMTQ